MTNSLNSVNKGSTLDYCITKATPEGSNLYYAVLFDNEKNKNIIISFHAFLNELSDIIYECSDPGVARIKFKWWQDEIERLKNRQPRHPVTRQFLQCILINDETIDVFKKSIDDFEQLLFLEQPDSISTILLLFKTCSGEIWKQCAKQLGVLEINTLNAIVEMGATYHFLLCLQQPHIYITEIRCVIPSLYMDKSKLFKLIATHSESNQEQNNIFKPLLLDLIDNLNANYKQISQKNGSLFRHGLILNRIAIKTAEEIQKEGCQIMTTSISLTPIRKLWIAWMTNLFI